jgi:hypothetical protein
VAHGIQTLPLDLGQDQLLDLIGERIQEDFSRSTQICNAKQKHTLERRKEPGSRRRAALRS